MIIEQYTYILIKKKCKLKINNMKKSLLLLLTIGLLTFSCGTSTENEQSEESIDSTTVQTSDNESKPIVNEKQKSESSPQDTQADNSGTECDKLIDEYRKWADDYIVLIKRAKKTPSDQETINKGMQMAKEFLEWANKWKMNAACAKSDGYAKEFEEITKEIEKALKEN